MAARGTRETVAGAILAGGRGERLGSRPKALLRVPGGGVLIERTLAVLDAVASPVLVSVAGAGPVPEAFARLGRAIVADATRGQGPLAGIAAVLEASPSELVLIVACDMPSLEPRLLAHLIALARAREDVLAVVPRTREGLHPLHAVYSRALLPRLRAALAAGRLAVRDALAAGGTLEVPEEELRRFDPDLASLANVNTPEDLARVLGPDGARAALESVPPC